MSQRKSSDDNDKKGIFDSINENNLKDDYKQEQIQLIKQYFTVKNFTVKHII